MTEYNEIKPKENLDPKNEEETEQEETETRFEKVVTGDVKKYKKGLTERIVSAFIGPEGIRSVGGRVNEDIIKPAVRNLVVDAIQSGVEMFAYRGEPRQGGTPRGRTFSGTQVNNRHWQRPTQYNRPPMNYGQASVNNQLQQTVRDPYTRSSSTIKEYILSARHEALDVQVALKEHILNYGYATIADYYDLIGVDPQHTDNEWGWSDLSYSQVRSVRGGYIITFPQPTPL